MELLNSHTYGGADPSSGSGADVLRALPRPLHSCSHSGDGVGVKTLSATSCTVWQDADGGDGVVFGEVGHGSGVSLHGREMVAVNVELPHAMSMDVLEVRLVWGCDATLMPGVLRLGLLRFCGTASKVTE